MKWFSSSAFGGTNYSNTPAGGVTHTDEPGLYGVSDSTTYFGRWAEGRPFAICAWLSSPWGHVYQVVGDPLLKR